MILHTFGDSHCLHTWDKIKINGLTINRHHIGSVTCASFGIQKLNLLNIKNFGVNEGDAICFCFGEIDCRCHICKPQNVKKYKELIDEIVLRYFEAIKINVEQYENLIIIVFNIVPTKRAIGNLLGNKEFPRMGSDEERILATKYMNKKLNEYCKIFKYIFFDVYDKYCDKDGFLDKELSKCDGFLDTGDIHIRNEIYLMEGLKEIIK
jgi:hypothetical protein